MDDARQARRDKVSDCADRGVCFYCDKLILDGEPRYSVLHAHWDCYEKSTDFTTRDPLGVPTMADINESIEKIDASIAALVAASLERPLKRRR